MTNDGLRNDESRMTKHPMTKEVRNPNDELRCAWWMQAAGHSTSPVSCSWSFVLRHSFVIGYFVIRHCAARFDPNGEGSRGIGAHIPVIGRGQPFQGGVSAGFNDKRACWGCLSHEPFNYSEHIGFSFRIVAIGWRAEDEPRIVGQAHVAICPDEGAGDEEFGSIFDSQGGNILADDLGGGYVAFDECGRVGTATEGF